MRFSVVAVVERFHFDRRNGNATPSRKSPKVTCGSGALAVLAFTSFMKSRLRLLRVALAHLRVQPDGVILLGAAVPILKNPHLALAVG